MLITTEKLTPSLIEEILPILEVHREELSKYKDMILKPDWDMYYTLQNKEALEVYIVRDEDSNIKGYAVYFLSTNAHYSDFLYAHQDVFYVSQDRRGSRIAYNLIKYSEQKLKEKGVSVIVHHTKTTNRFGEMLGKLGYGVAEVMYHKRIDL